MTFFNNKTILNKRKTKYPRMTLDKSSGDIIESRFLAKVIAKLGKIRAFQDAVAR